METILLISIIAIILVSTIVIVSNIKKYVKNDLKETKQTLSSVIADINMIKQNNRDFNHRIQNNFTNIHTLERLLYKPLYNEGEIIYFNDCSIKGNPERKGEIIEVIEIAGEIPSYKILIGKENKIVPQLAITAWE